MDSFLACAFCLAATSHGSNAAAAGEHAKEITLLHDHNDLNDRAIVGSADLHATVDGTSVPNLVADGRLALKITIDVSNNKLVNLTGQGWAT